MGKELFVGTFVHSVSLAQLEIGENGVIGVENGKIVFVDKNVKDLESLKKTKGFEDANVRKVFFRRSDTNRRVGHAIEWKSILYPRIH